MRLAPKPEALFGRRLYRIDDAGELFAVVAENEQQAREWFVATFEAGNDLIDDIREAHDWDKFIYADPAEHPSSGHLGLVARDPAVNRRAILLHYKGEVPGLAWTTSCD